MTRRAMVRARGNAAVWAMVTMPVMVGFASFAVDLGRMHLTKTELQSGLDAATRYAVTGLADNTAVAKAISCAAENNVLNHALALTAADVSVGKYDAATRTFTANATPADAVLIRKTLSGTAGVPMVFGSFFGITWGRMTVTGCAAVSGTATACTGGLAGFVGRDYFNVNGPLTVRAWDSATQAAAPSSSWAVGQTQGNVNLNSGVNFQGEIQHQSGGGVSMNQATVSRGITTLASPIDYASPTTPATGVTSLGNYNGPSGSSQTFAAGKYYCDTFNVPSGKTVVFSGAAQLYVNGSCNIGGAITTYQNVPSNLKVNIVSGAGGDIGTNASPLYMDLYAPDSPFNLNNRTFYGSLVSKGVNVNSGFTMNIDRQSFDQNGDLRTSDTPTTMSIKSVRTVN